MTTYPTITGGGANGTSGDKRAGEHFFRNRTRRKRLFPNGKEVSDPFGSKMSGGPITSLRPELRQSPHKSRRSSFLCGFFCMEDLMTTFNGIAVADEINTYDGFLLF